MGPTCSIVFENEPMEKNAMQQKPRSFKTTFFNSPELLTSIIQGLAISAGTLFTYQYAVRNGFSEAHTRTMVFTVLVAANIFLTLQNRSFYYSIFTTIKYRNNLVLLIISITSGIMLMLLYIPVFTAFFLFERLSFMELGFCVLIGLISVLWYELVKIRTRWRSKNRINLNVKTRAAL